MNRLAACITLLIIMSRPFKPLDEFSPVEKRRRYLPHWEQEGCTYFLTWRMADSVPESVYRPWQEERKAFWQMHPKPWADEVWKEYHQRFTRRMEQWLDAGHGSCALKAPALRGIVEESLRYFDGKRYDLESWVIMPNHVHVLVCPRPSWGLEPLLHTWKSYTAGLLNEQLGCRGTFWMDETFDHIVRSEVQLHHYRRYIRENPVKAGLQEGEYTHWEVAR